MTTPAAREPTAWTLQDEIDKLVETSEEVPNSFFFERELQAGHRA